MPISKKLLYIKKINLHTKRMHQERRRGEATILQSSGLLNVASGWQYNLTDLIYITIWFSLGPFILKGDWRFCPLFVRNAAYCQHGTS